MWECKSELRGGGGGREYKFGRRSPRVDELIWRIFRQRSVRGPPDTPGFQEQMPHAATRVGCPGTDFQAAAPRSPSLWCPGRTHPPCPLGPWGAQGCGNVAEEPQESDWGLQLSSPLAAVSSSVKWG